MHPTMHRSEKSSSVLVAPGHLVSFGTKRDLAIQEARIGHIVVQAENVNQAPSALGHGTSFVYQLRPAEINRCPMNYKLDIYSHNQAFPRYIITTLYICLYLLTYTPIHTRAHKPRWIFRGRSKFQGFYCCGSYTNQIYTYIYVYIY